MRFILMFIASCLLAGCSVSKAVEKMTTPEDRALVIAVAGAACDGTLSKYQKQMSPEIWAEVQKNPNAVRSHCPEGAGTSKVMGYNFNSNITNGKKSGTDQFVVITEGKNRWTRAVITRVAKDGGPMMITGIAMSSTAEKPADVAQMESLEKTLPYIWGGAAFVLLGLIAVVIWLIRRESRKKL